MGLVVLLQPTPGVGFMDSIYGGLIDNYAGGEPVNVGVGEDLSIGELASLVGEVVGYEGEIVYDTTKPDGTARKLLEVGKLDDLGWRASIPLRESIQQTYAWFLGSHLSRSNR